MNPESWQQIGDVFEQALAFPTAERHEWVEHESLNTEIRHEVLSLLASHDAAPGGFVQDQIKGAVLSFQEATLDQGPVRRVGPYRLVSELGRGGMGTVFLAERDDDQYEAKVAIKLIRPGMDTEFILTRFRRERQTLARLQHPNIGRLLDGGTDSGLPYIVMEYIDGPYITVHARNNRLSIADRLRLFLNVCSAVDYAHRNFVIHRDIKPSNVLVDHDGVPKLLDFGICKLLRDDGFSDGENQRGPLTPNYASPEQISGDPTTLLSDVYSLGVVLYELLAETLPRRIEKLHSECIGQPTSRSHIALPSIAAVDNATATRLAGDLDSIVMRALEDEPNHRYESAAQLADDLRRYLSHEPVHAREGKIGYKIFKFARRYRVSVAAAALVFLSLTIGIALTLRASRVASLRLDQIRTLSNRLVFDLHDAVRDLPGATHARELIVQTGIEYLDAASSSVEGDPHAEKNLAKAYERLGDIEGEVAGANLGNSSGALTSYRKAIALLDDVSRRNPSDTGARTERLVLYQRIGAIQANTGALSQAQETLRAGIEWATPFASSKDPAFKAALASLYLDSGDAKRNAGDWEGSLKDANECLRLYKQAEASVEPSATLSRALAEAYAGVGVSESRLGNLHDALDHFRMGTAEMTKVVSSDPRNVPDNRELMMLYGHEADVLGNSGMQNLGDRAGAFNSYRKAAAIARNLYMADPADERAAEDYGIILSRVETVIDDRDFSSKLALERESLKVLGKAAAMSPDNTSLSIYQSLVNQDLGDSLAAVHDDAGAREAYLKSSAIAESLMKLGHASAMVLFVHANQKLALNSASQTGRAEALDFARRALRAGDNAPPGTPTWFVTPRSFAAMGLTYADLVHQRWSEPQDREQAALWLRKSLDAWRIAQAKPGFGAPHQREMLAVQDALTKIESK